MTPQSNHRDIFFHISCLEDYDEFFIFDYTPAMW